MGTRAMKRSKDELIRNDEVPDLTSKQQKLDPKQILCNLLNDAEEILLPWARNTAIPIRKAMQKLLCCQEAMNDENMSELFENVTTAFEFIKSEIEHVRDLGVEYNHGY